MSLKTDRLVGVISRIAERIAPEYGAHHRFFITASVFGAFAGAVWHFSMVVLFWLVGVVPMALFNVVSTAAWIAAVLIPIRSGRPEIGAAIVIPELVLHAFAATYFVGWSAGFHLLLLLTANTVIDIPKRLRRAFSLVCVPATTVLYLLMYFWFRDTEPVYRLSENLYVAIFLFNVGSVVTFLLLIEVIAIDTASDGLLALEKLHRRARRLLLNVLPEPVADRLDVGESLIADRYEHASVLFLDIVGFTEMSASLPAHEVVTILNDVFSRFDTLVDRHQVEKIKTIGDAYMAVAGAPEKQDDHAHRAADLALEMLSGLEDYCRTSGTQIDARIGIASGPIIAGVIGRRKFIYDLWGDTVNTASRMESYGIPKRIQVAESTYLLLRADYELEHRGTLDVKGKGALSTYFLIGKHNPS